MDRENVPLWCRRSFDLWQIKHFACTSSQKEVSCDQMLRIASVSCNVRSVIDQDICSFNLYVSRQCNGERSKRE